MSVTVITSFRQISLEQIDKPCFIFPSSHRLHLPSLAGVADSYIKLSTGLSQLGTIEGPRLEKFINKVSDTFEKARVSPDGYCHLFMLLVYYIFFMVQIYTEYHHDNKLSSWQKVEGRVASDEDLKLSDTLRYYVRDGSAAKDLLYRRLRCLANYEQANKNLDRARAKNKDVHAVSVHSGPPSMSPLTNSWCLCYDLLVSLLLFLIISCFFFPFFLFHFSSLSSVNFIIYHEIKDSS